MQNIDVCRVCHGEEEVGRPLFHPCNCSGSIKFVHQDCLVEWFKVSNKQHCELCGEKISFTKKYSPDTPKMIPTFEIGYDLFRAFVTAIYSYGNPTFRLVLWTIIFPIMTTYMTFCSTKFALNYSLPNHRKLYDELNWSRLLGVWLVGLVLIVCGMAFLVIVGVSIKFILLVSQNTF